MLSVRPFTLASPEAISLQQALHESVFSPGISASPPHRVALCWDKHCQLLPEVLGLTAKRVAAWSAEEVRRTAAHTVPAPAPRLHDLALSLPGHYLNFFKLALRKCTFAVFKCQLTCLTIILGEYHPCCCLEKRLNLKQRAVRIFLTVHVRQRRSIPIVPSVYCVATSSQDFGVVSDRDF